MNEYEQGYNAAKADIMRWLLDYEIIGQYGVGGYFAFDYKGFDIMAFDDLLLEVESAEEERKDK